MSGFGVRLKDFLFLSKSVSIQWNCILCSLLECTELLLFSSIGQKRVLWYSRVDFFFVPVVILKHQPHFQFEKGHCLDVRFPEIHFHICQTHSTCVYHVKLYSAPNWICFGWFMEKKVVLYMQHAWHTHQIVFYEMLMLCFTSQHLHHEGKMLTFTVADCLEGINDQFQDSDQQAVRRGKTGVLFNHM